MAKRRQPRQTSGDADLRAAWAFHSLARRLDVHAPTPDADRLAKVRAAYERGIGDATLAPTWPERLTAMAAAFSTVHPQHWTRDCQRSADADFDTVSADERRAFADDGGLEVLPERSRRHCFDSAVTIERRTAQRRVMGWAV